MKTKIFILMLLSFFVIDEADAQRRSRKARKTRKERQEERLREQQETLADKLNYEIKVGSITFNSGFGIGLKGNAGYKATNWLTAGIGGKMEYNFVNNVGSPDLSFLDIGGLGFVRGKINESIYLQAEYDFMSYDNPSGERTNISYPLIGGGYLTGGDRWKTGIELLFIIDDRARDLTRQTIEYWVNFSYNF